jgi:nucleoside-diphosphate-sugar epimerase
LRLRIGLAHLKVLVTGGSGFIGRNLVERLQACHLVSAPSRGELDLLDAPAVREYLEDHRFDAVIHAASEGVIPAVAGEGQVLAHNCRMFFNLARNSHSFGRMLFLSSGAIYDRAHWQPRMREDYFDAHVPADDYGFSKYLCAKAAQAMDRVYELRVFGVFGPYEDWRVRFVSNACCRALWGLPIVIRQNLWFDYLDVDDLGRILERCPEKDLRHRQYNVCRGTAFELKALAAKVAAISGRSLEIRVLNEGPGNEYSGDNSRLLSEFTGFEFTGIDHSLARLYRWHEARKASIDPALL